MLLYRYFTAEFAIKALETNRVKVGRLHELNDPFDCYPQIQVDAELAEGERPDKWDSILSDWIQRIGVICYSATITDPLMWAHYGDKHRGIALEFRWPAGQLPHKVAYLEDRPIIKAVELEVFSAVDAVQYSLDVITRGFTVKAPSWDYEGEYRSFYHLADCYTSGGLYFMDLADAFLSAVVLGARCPIDESYLKTTLKNHGHDKVIVRRAELSRSTYKIQA